MKTHKIIFALLILLALVLIASFVPAFQKTAQEPNNVVQLIRPAFLQTAHAQESPEGFDIGQMLDEEAGISAYFQTQNPIDLALVDDLYKTIEIQTSEYVLGSMDIANYPDRYDPHVYIHADGWIMTYYFNDEPVSKIIDIKVTGLDSTLFNNIIVTVAGVLGEPVPDVTYYDFRYPNATNMMFIAEYSNGSFDINITSAFGYSERSWSLRNDDCCANFYIDGVAMPKIFWDGASGFGYITVAQLLPDVDHVIAPDDAGVLVLVYTVP